MRGDLTPLACVAGAGIIAADVTAQTGASVLADLIGIADTTATRWAALAARDWTSYIAERGGTGQPNTSLGQQTEHPGSGESVAAGIME